MKKILSAALALVCIWFASPALAALPSGYTQLEYIESTGTQYIDTGITVLDSDEVKLKACVTNTGSIFMFSQGLSANNKAYQLANTSADKVVFDIENYNPYRITSNVSAYDVFREFHIKNKELFIDGVSQGVSTGTLTSATETMKLMYNASSSTAQENKYSYFEVKSKINLIPAKRNSDNVIGMYDTVSGTFFTNAGTGEFIAGAPVTTCDGTVVNYVSATGTGVQNGIPTPDNPIEPTFYKQGNMILRAVGDYADTYDATTGKITRRIGEYIFTGRESIDVQYNVYGVTTIPYDMDKVTNASLCSHNKTYVNNLVTGSDRTFDKFLFFTNVNKVGFGLSDTPPEITNTETFKQWLAAQYANGTPVTIYYPLAEETTEDWPASQCTTDPIKIATTKYNETKFSPLNTALQNAISVVDTVVTQTITQAGRIADLQAQKQTRPADDPSDANNAENCPAGKKCLLVEDASGIPHWYEIVERYSLLPDGYTELEYLQGNGSTRITPGVTINSNLSVDIKYEILTAGWLLGATAGVNGRWGVTSGTTFWSGTSGVADISSAINLSGINTATFNYKTGATVNGVDIPFDTKQTYGDITSSHNFYLFTADGTSVNTQEHKIYYTKIYKNGSLVRDLIPAKRNSDGVLGMYDTVSGTFFTNAGTGDFIGGQPVFN